MNFMKNRRMYNSKKKFAYSLEYNTYIYIRRLAVLQIVNNLQKQLSSGVL